MDIMKHLFDLTFSVIARYTALLIFIYITIQTVRYGIISFLNHDIMNPNTNPLLSYDRDEMESE